MVNVAKAREGLIVRQAGPTALADGNLFIEDIDVPSEPIAPGGTARVNVVVGNGATVIRGDDPNGCAFRPTGFNGYLTRLVVDPEWTSAKTPENCVETATFGIGTWTEELTFTVPQDPGFYAISFGLEFPNTGEAGGTVSRTIEVAEGGQPDPDPDPGDGNGGGGDGGDSIFEQVESVLIIVAVIVALLLAGNLAGG